VQMLVGSLPSVLPQVKANRLRALAVTTPQRSPFVPELPTVSEAAIPGFEARQWWGVFVPAKTPSPVIAKIHGEIQKLLAVEDVKTRLADEGAAPVRMSPEEFNATVKNDIAKWKKLAQELKL